MGRAPFSLPNVLILLGQPEGLSFVLFWMYVSKFWLPSASESQHHRFLQALPFNDQTPEAEKKLRKTSTKLPKGRIETLRSVEIVV
jgi:hypothetical protein